MIITIVEYECQECNGKFYTKFNEMNANYCPYCGSDLVNMGEIYVVELDD